MQRQEEDKVEDETKKKLTRLFMSGQRYVRIT